MSQASRNSYGGLPAILTSVGRSKLEGPLKWLGNVAMVGGLIGLFVHYLRFRPQGREDEDTNAGSEIVSQSRQMLPQGILR